MALRFANGTEPQTLDPHRMTGQPEGRLAWALFEGLTRYDERSFEPVPGAAAHWKVSDDGRRYTFTLREDARWSDGRPLRAEDFAWSWRRLQDPALGAEYAYILHGVRLAEAFNTYEAQAERLDAAARATLLLLHSARAGGRDGPGVGAAVWRDFAARRGLAELCRASPDADVRALATPPESGLDAAALRRAAVALGREAARRRTRAAHARAHFGIDEGVYAADARTLVVELEAPIPYFLSLVAFYPAMPVPRHVVEAPGNANDWFLPGKIVSNGPFVLQSWRVNERIRLARSPTYWGRDAVGSETIDALPVENAMTALNLYLTGELDWLPSVYPSDLADALRERDDFYAHPGLGIYYYLINTRRPPFDDVRVRRAVNLAIDREQIAREVLRLGQLPATTFVPPGMAGYEPPPSPLGLRVEQARRLLADAGHPDGRGLESIGILYNTSEDHRKIAEVIADQLRRNLGLDVRAYNQEWQSYLATRAQGDYQLARAGWIGDYVDPNTFLDLWTSTSGNNQSGWSDPLYDRLIEAATDPAAFARDPGALALDVKEPARLRERVRAWRDAPPGQRLARAAELRMQLLREAEAILVQDALPVMPIYFYVNSGLLRPWVRGFHVSYRRPDGTRVINLQGIHPLRALRVIGREGRASP